MLKCLRACVLKSCVRLVHRVACACVRARRRMRKTCVCVRSFSLFLSIVLSPLLSFAACVPRAQHHLSSLSYLSPGPIFPSSLLLIPLDLWDLFLSLSLSFSFSLSFFVSFILDFFPRFPDYIKKRPKIYPCTRHTDLLED